MNDRGCTDILCCLVFIAFIVVFVGVAGYGFTNGDPYKLLSTWDKDGNACGYNMNTLNKANNNGIMLDMTAYPLLYFPSLDYKSASTAVSSA